jgi:hypothetical protein
MLIGMIARMRGLLRQRRRVLTIAGTVTAATAMVVLPFALHAAASSAPEITAAGSVTTWDREATVTATCQRGYSAVGVSAELRGFADVRITKMWPQGRVAIARGTASAPVTSPWTLRAQAICVRNSLGVEARTAVNPAGGWVAATCAPGKELVGLGWAVGGGGWPSSVGPYRSGDSPWPTGGYPTGTGGFPTGTGGFPTGTGGFPTGTGGFPTGTGGFPTGTGGFPTGTGGYPTGTGGFPTGTGGFPTGTGGFPTGTGGFPTGTGGYPTGTGGYPTGTGGYPTGTGGFPTGTGGFPTGTGAGNGRYDTVIATASTPIAVPQEIAVTAICAWIGFGVNVNSVFGEPDGDGTVRLSSRCARHGSHVTSLGFVLGANEGRLRALTMTGKGRTSQLVITHSDPRRATGGMLTTVCAF